MFVSDNQSRRENGSVLVIVLIIVGIFGLIAASQVQRYKQLLSTYAKIEFNESKKAWAQAISERVDCVRIMNPYTPMNRCPNGTSRVMVFNGEVPMSASGPDNSYSLNSEWHAKVECGVSDLKVRLAKYVDGAYAIDPQTGAKMDFDNPGSVISDKASGVSLCPGYFGTGAPKVRTYTTSIATLQNAAVNLRPDGTLLSANYTCDGKLGLIGNLDDFPLRPLFRKNGVPNVRNAPSQQLFMAMRNEFTAWGMPGNLNPAWDHWPIYIQMMGVNHCSRACTWQFNYSFGVIAKCDPSAPITTAPGEFRPDDTSSQAVCICMK